MFWIAASLNANHWDHTTLNEWLLCIRSLFESNFYPLMSIQMKNDHVLTHHSIFWLTTINYHWSFVVDCRMIFSNTNWNSFCFENVDGEIVAIVLYYLIRALPDLPLPIEHKTSSEHHNLTLILDSRMALTSLNNLLWTKRDFLPGNRISHNLRFWNFFDRLIVHPTNHVHWLSNLCYSRTLTRWRNPRLTAWLYPHFSPKSFSFLHSLNVALKTASKFFC